MAKKKQRFQEVMKLDLIAGEDRERLVQALVYSQFDKQRTVLLLDDGLAVVQLRIRHVLPNGNILEVEALLPFDQPEQFEVEQRVQQIVYDRIKELSPEQAVEVPQ